MPRLRIPNPPPGVPAVLEVPPAGAALGREADNHLLLAAPSVSRHHAVLRPQDGAWQVEDLGSANGTFVNDQRVERSPLRSGDRLRLGELTLVFEEDAPAPPPPPPPPAVAAPAPRARGWCGCLVGGCLGALLLLGGLGWWGWSWIRDTVTRPGTRGPAPLAQLPLRPATGALPPPRVAEDPGGAAPTLQPLPAPPRALPKGVEPLSVHRVGPAGSHRLPEAVVLEFPYDAGRLPAGANPEDRLALAHLDEGTGRWILAAAQVDPERRVLRTRTRHLSVWSTLYITGGWRVARSRRFTVVFSPGEPIVFAPPKGASGKAPKGEIIDASDYARQLGRTLDLALEHYERAGFKVPEGDSGEDGRIWAFLGHATADWQGEEAAESQWVAFSGNLLFPANYETRRQADHDAAHELFHKIQNLDLNLVSMDQRRWWIEAAADYAAARIALQQGGSDTTMGEAIKPRYLEKSLTFSIPKDDGTQPQSFHDYSTSHFLDYLVKQGVDFKALYDAVVDPSWVDLLEVLDPMDKHLRKTLGASRGLDSLYRDFARFYLLDPASPMPRLTQGLWEEVPSARLSLGAGDRQGRLQASVEGPHASQVLAIRADAAPGKPTRRLQLTQAAGTGSGLITGIFKVRPGTTSAVASHSPIGSLGAAPVVAEVGPGDLLLVIACNGTSATRSLGVEVKDLSPEAPKAATPAPSGGVRRLLRVTAFGWASWDRVARWNGVEWGSRWMSWGTQGDDVVIPEGGAFSTRTWAGGFNLELSGEITSDQVVSLTVKGRRAVQGDIQDTFEVVIRGLPVVKGDPRLYQAMATPLATTVPKDVGRFVTQATYERVFPNGERQVLAGVNWNHRMGPWSTLPDSPHAQCSYVTVQVQKVNARNEPVP